MTLPRAVDVTTALPVAFVQIKVNREVEILVQVILDEVHFTLCSCLSDFKLPCRVVVNLDLPCLRGDSVYVKLFMFPNHPEISNMAVIIMF